MGIYQQNMIDTVLGKGYVTIGYYGVKTMSVGRVCVIQNSCIDLFLLETSFFFKKMFQTHFYYNA